MLRTILNNYHNSCRQEANAVGGTDDVTPMAVDLNNQRDSSETTTDETVPIHRTNHNNIHKEVEAFNHIHHDGLVRRLSLTPASQCRHNRRHEDRPYRHSKYFSLSVIVVQMFMLCLYYAYVTYEVNEDAVSDGRFGESVRNDRTHPSAYSRLRINGFTQEESTERLVVYGKPTTTEQPTTTRRNKIMVGRAGSNVDPWTSNSTFKPKYPVGTFFPGKTLPPLLSEEETPPVFAAGSGSTKPPRQFHFSRGVSVWTKPFVVPPKPTVRLEEPTSPEVASSAEEFSGRTSTNDSTETTAEGLGEETENQTGGSNITTTDASNVVGFWQKFTTAPPTTKESTHLMHTTTGNTTPTTPMPILANTTIQLAATSSPPPRTTWTAPTPTIPAWRHFMRKPTFNPASTRPPGYGFIGRTRVQQKRPVEKQESSPWSKQITTTSTTITSLLPTEDVPEIDFSQFHRVSASLKTAEPPEIQALPRRSGGHVSDPSFRWHKELLSSANTKRIEDPYHGKPDYAYDYAMDQPISEEDEITTQVQPLIENVTAKETKHALRKGTRKEISSTEYSMFEDAHIMIFVGFGFLFTFLKRYGFSGAGLNMLIAAIAVQWAILCEGFFNMHEDDNLIKISVEKLMDADVAAAATLISWGAVLGRVSPLQALVMVILEIPLYALNEWILLSVLQATDPGASMICHLFGAYFGLAMSLMLYKKEHAGHPKQSTTYNSDLFAMIGTLFLWVLWPSFNSALLSGDSRHRAVINTYLSLAAACVVTFAVSSLLETHNRFTMAHIQNATLAGGVAVGTTCGTMMGPYVALIAGSGAAIICVLGFKYLTPFLETRLRTLDTCGVNNLHGMIGLYAGVLGSIIAATTATEDIYGNNVYKIYPPMAPAKGHPDLNELLHMTSGISAGEGRTAGEQATYQIAATFVSLGIALVGGAFTGIIMRLSIFDNLQYDQVFDDSDFWEIPEDEEQFPPSNQIAAQQRKVSGAIKSNDASETRI